MSLPSSLRRPVAAAALGAALVTASAGVAGAATISDPVVIKPGAKLPIDFAGYKEPANNKLPANFRIVERKVELGHREAAKVRLTAPEGFRLVTIGVPEGSPRVGASVNDVHYPGKRAVTVLVRDRTAGDQGAQLTVYALAKRA